MTKFLKRDCPGCGSGRRQAEVASERKAENLSLEELRPFWSGLFKEKVFFTYDRCEECGLLYAPTFFHDGQLTELYSSMAPNMDLVPTEAIIATQRGYFDCAMKGLRPDGGYLEIGPDVGHIVGQAAKDPRFDHFWLFEPNLAVHDALAKMASGRRQSIISEMTDLSVVPDGSVALAVMIHVLDHLIDPRAMLEQIRSKLKPDGRLAIVTHNEHSLLRSMMRKRFPPFCLQHPELYNPRSIRLLLHRAGFSKVKVSRSKNYFPLSFMVRQALYTVGLKADRLPLPKAVIGLRLGNIMTVAEP